MTNVEQIEGTVGAFFDAWNERDIRRIGPLLEERAELVNSLGLWWRGAAEVIRPAVNERDRSIALARIDVDPFGDYKHCHLCGRRHSRRLHTTQRHRRGGPARHRYILLGRCGATLADHRRSNNSR